MLDEHGLVSLLEKLVNEVNAHAHAIIDLRHETTILQTQMIDKDKKIQELESTIVDLQILK